MKEVDKVNKIVNRRSFIGAGSLGLMLSPLLNPFAKASNLIQNQGPENSCSLIPSETAGPYPAHSDDRGVNVLSQKGIVRSDIISSLGTSDYPGTAVALGIPLTVRIRLVDSTNGCVPLENYAVYLWHCDQTGLYSMYNQEVIEETYLRGVQVSDSEGWLEFQTVYPGCYDGRMVHMHFDIFKSLDLAINDENITKTSQLTFPVAVSKSVYENHSNIYTNGLQNLNRISFETDNVFSDGVEFQVANIDSGNANTGYVSSIVVGVDPKAKEQQGGGPGGPGFPPPGGRRPFPGQF